MRDRPVGNRAKTLLLVLVRDWNGMVCVSCVGSHNVQLLGRGKRWSCPQPPAHLFLCSNESPLCILYYYYSPLLSCITLLHPTVGIFSRCDCRAEVVVCCSKELQSNDQTVCWETLWTVHRLIKSVNTYGNVENSVQQQWGRMRPGAELSWARSEPG